MVGYPSPPASLSRAGRGKGGGGHINRGPEGLHPRQGGRGRARSGRNGDDVEAEVARVPAREEVVDHPVDPRLSTRAAATPGRSGGQGGPGFRDSLSRRVDGRGKDFSFDSGCVQTLERVPARRQTPRHLPGARDLSRDPGLGAARRSKETLG